MTFFQKMIIPLLLLATGCTSVLSDIGAGTVNENIAFREVLKDPEQYQGEIVLWSGIVLDIKHLKKGTMLEVLQTPTDREGRPENIDQSKGRFLALYKGYLDSAVYRQGREITLVGEINGKRVLPMDEIEYTFPLLKVVTIHLWKERYYNYSYPPSYMQYHYRRLYYPFWDDPYYW